MESLQQETEMLKTLHFTSNYIEQSIAITEKWAETGIFAGIDDPYIMRQVAQLLQNQILFNQQVESITIPEDASTTFDAKRWLRFTLPIIRRVFGDFVGYKWVSVQMLRQPQDVFTATGIDGRQSTQLIAVSTRNTGRFEMDDFGSTNEEELLGLDNFCSHYKKEMELEIARDLTTIASSTTQANYVDEEQLMTLIEGMSAYIGAKIKEKDATWLITGPKIIKLLRPKISDWQENSTYRGILNEKWRVYELSSHSNSILMGYKSDKNHYLSGYFYCPYKPLEVVPGWWKPDTTHAHGRNFARYAKKLINSDFYGVINLTNIPEEINTTESEA